LGTQSLRRGWLGPLSGYSGGWRMEWKDVMAFGVHSDRVVIIEGPVGSKRTWLFPGPGVEPEARAHS
jgi:hypothetical protein